MEKDPPALATTNFFPLIALPSITVGILISSSVPCPVLALEENPHE